MAAAAVERDLCSRERRKPLGRGELLLIDPCGTMKPSLSDPTHTFHQPGRLSAAVVGCLVGLGLAWAYGSMLTALVGRCASRSRVTPTVSSSPSSPWGCGGFTGSVRRSSNIGPRGGASPYWPARPCCAWRAPTSTSTGSMACRCCRSSCGSGLLVGGWPLLRQAAPAVALLSSCSPCRSRWRRRWPRRCSSWPPPSAPTPSRRSACRPWPRATSSSSTTSHRRAGGVQRPGHAVGLLRPLDDGRPGRPPAAGERVVVFLEPVPDRRAHEPGAHHRHGLVYARWAPRPPRPSFTTWPAG